jgi:hypothetical protein
LFLAAALAAATGRVRIRALNFGEMFSFVPEEPGPASS